MTKIDYEAAVRILMNERFMRNRVFKETKQREHKLAEIDKVIFVLSELAINAGLIQDVKAKQSRPVQESLFT